MKKFLVISFVLNLGLAGSLFYFLANHRHLKEQSVTVQESSMPLQVVHVSTTPPRVQQSEPEPFQWRQLESATDYRIYVKNLRGIGCPEQTLRDIVTGNVDRAFTAKRNQLGLDGSEPGPWSERAEIRFINELLGETGDSTVSGLIAQGQNSGQDSVAYPLVLHKVNLAALGLNDDQKQVIERIRQQFIDAVGGPYQDPRDPGYRERWEKAQPESDDMLKAMLGMSLYENYQLAAADPVGN